MTMSPEANKILSQISIPNTKLGDLRVIAKGIKKNHSLAMELWSSGKFLPRQLAILIMDSKLLTQQVINHLDSDIQGHNPNEQTQLIDWLMANQLAKDKSLMVLMESWENSPSSLQRRIFWYYQGRLRWVGQTPPLNTEYLLSKIETNILKEPPEVQWAMNFTAGWIGVYEIQYRNRCITIGEKTELYKGQKVSKGCTPNYLPEFIAIEAAKRKKA